MTPRHYLVGTRDRFAGVVTREQLEGLNASGRANDPLSAVVANPFVHAHPDHSIDVVLERLSESDGFLPVVSRTAVQRVEGVITRASVLDSWGTSKPGLDDAATRDSDFS